MRWLGHLDILRTFERAIRRAALPVAFTQGFNPRERLVFASALSVGTTGGAERATLELTDPVSPEVIQTLLNAAMPPGIRIQDCGEIALTGARDLLNRFDHADYEAVCACPDSVTDAEATAALQQILSAEALHVSREREGRIRHVDIRPYLQHLALQPGSLRGDRMTLEMTVTVGEGSAKPPEIVAALAERLPGLKLRRLHRVRLFSCAPEPLQNAVTNQSATSD